MTAERFRQIRNVFEAALDRSDADRVTWLEEACQDDIQLRAEVDALLKHYQKRSEILDAVVGTPPTGRMEGRRVGAWEILREIGRGGMAVVYLARRADGAFHMQAAVKLLNISFVDEESRKRFQQERDILARLQHPNITRLLDGGATEERLPYLVMEYVEGLPITAWCDSRKAAVDERLRLFEQLCGVVQYLHENGVIHRDLKPRNVLVNRAGTVKLLDFGISKMLEPQGDQTLLATRSGLHLLTPEYASPEQVRGERLTPRTDVYALGVILYELLAGRRPYRIRTRVIHEVMRAICEDEPEWPSSIVTRPDEAADGTPIEPVATSRLRQLSPEGLSLALRGDLDRVVMKALRKAPERRYMSAQQFAADLSAHTQGKPILARGDSWLARGFQLLNRHRPAVALTIAVIVLLSSGAVTVHKRAIAYGGAASLVFGFWYAATDRKLGRRLASAGQSLWIVFLMCWMVLEWRRNLPLPPVLARVIKEGVLTIQLALWLVLAVYSLAGWIYRRQWGGELILDASPPKQRKNLTLFVLLSVAFILLLLTVYFREGLHQLISYTPMAILLISLWATSGKLEFRQRGIVKEGRLIPWDEIDSWSWQTREGSPTEVEDNEEAEIVQLASSVFGSQPNVSGPNGTPRPLDRAVEYAVLKIERRRVLQFVPAVRIVVLASKVEEITRVMNRYLSEWPSLTI